MSDGYDAAGNLTTVVNGRGHTISYSYDADNERAGIAYANGSSVTYTYTVTGLRAGMTDATGAITYIYDAASRLTKLVQPNGAITYSYDAANNRASMTVPGEKTTTYGYDQDNRLSSVTDWRGGVTTTSYDAAGRVTGTGYANGVSGAYGYDAANRPTSLTYSKGSTLGSFTYTYDGDGNRLSATDGSGVTTYSYDALNRLTSAATPSSTTSYSYDAAGNRTQTISGTGTITATYNAANELTSTSTSTYSYDADGNRVTTTTGGGTTTYTYDDANYLTGASGGTHSSSYTYNGDHVRVGSTVDGTSTSELVDLATPLPDVVQQQTGATTTTYLYGGGLLGQDDGSAMQTLLPDALGSVRLVTDASGAVVGTASYDPYGAQTTSGTGSTFGSTGQQADAASGLVYLRARMYDPATGVFLQRDSGPNGWNHPYSYASDNPTDNFDPSGQTVTSICFSTHLSLFVGASGQYCYNWDSYGSSNFTVTANGYVGTSVGLGISGQLQGSTTDRVSDLLGTSTSGGGSVGLGVVSGGVDLSPSSDACSPPTATPSVSISTPFDVSLLGPAEEHVGISNSGPYRSSLRSV